MALVTINGDDLYYKQVGLGIPALVMHGGLGLDHTYLHPWLDTLGQILNLVYYDHRCHGRSGRPPISTLTMARLCDDADALRRYLGIDKVIVIGHSFGGCIALTYALRYPRCISGLVLLDTTPSFNHGREIVENARRKSLSENVFARLGAAPPMDDGEMEADFRAILPLYFYEYDYTLADRLFADTVWNAAACRQGQKLMDEYDITSSLREIHSPTLIIAGRDDFICSPSRACIIHRAVPNSNLMIIEESGHFPYVERPDEFFSIVLNWIYQHNYS
ncbi:MAG: alpha/beta fold hydrolase [Chloroflexota bacterium]|nr:alpha/beta fold hydrolase [Chloroflexota bacterium]